MPRHKKQTNNGFRKHQETPLIVCIRMSNNARGILFLTYPPPLPNTLTPQNRLLLMSPK